MANLTPGSSDQEFLELLNHAREGDQDALGLLIERYRAYLLKIAHSESDERLQAKEGDSDLVQETCWKATRVFRQFKGQSAEELRAWLRRILRSELGSHRDHFHAHKRNIRTEVPLQDVDGGDSRNEKLATTGDSPSEQLVKKEERTLLELALQELREVDRQVIELRQKEGCDFAEIARRLNMTEEAAQKRWGRAVDSLREKVNRLK